MNASELRALQAPLKERYRDDPPSATVTLRAVGAVGADVGCRVETARGVLDAGLHPGAGGDGSAVCPGEVLLQALVGCAGVTLSAVATAIGVVIRHGEITVEGEMDFRGTLGVSKEVPVGFHHLRVRFDLETDATEQQLETLVRLAERYCVVFQTLAQSPVIEVTRRGADSSRIGEEPNSTGTSGVTRSE